MHPADFVNKWRASQHKESAAYQSHFDDLCRLVGHETPVEADPAGSFFCYQRSVAKESGRPGFADVWYQGYFGWEYKSKGADLDRAYQQLLQYRDNLGNPRLLIVCDFETIVIHTNFNGTVSRAYRVSLDDIASGELIEGTTLSGAQVLHACFYDPEQLKPGQTPEGLTEEAADDFKRIAAALRAAVSAKYDPVTRGYPRLYTDDQIARFLSKLVFCMFASDVGLLPKGIIGRLIDNNRRTVADLASALSKLFAVMNDGGDFGVEKIPHFNGGLFRDSEALEIPSDQVDALRHADSRDWTDIEPSIFGTLFERIIDPEKRRQLGKHYTSRDDIETIVRPVVMEALEREWKALQEELTPLTRWDTQTGQRRSQNRDTLRARLQGFLDHLGSLRILDPACGSGNFLYVTMDLLKTLERRVIAFGATHGVAVDPRVHPRQLFGIELNEYAHELASIVVWIGYLQWKRRNGFSMLDEDPVLQPLDNIRRMDAILDLSDPQNPKEPEWPEAEIVVGNPPFLGGKRLRAELGDDYVDTLFRVWDGKVRREADLCCYFHEKARARIEAGKTKRAGLLATQAIRGGANRETLKRIKATGDIFFAESDRPWILDGAAVRVSMVGFDDGSETRRVLDGRPVEGINSDLTSSTNLTQAFVLVENAGVSFIGVSMHGPFELPAEEAREMLRGANPNARPNSDVVVRWLNGLDVARRDRGAWAVFFPPGMPEEAAALYEVPFEHVATVVRPVRERNHRKLYRDKWWVFGEPRPSMLASIRMRSKYVATPRVAKHRLFVYCPASSLPTDQLVVFARDDDYFFGVLHSRAHELWARATGTQLREAESGFRYTPTTCFETFPLPWPPGKEPQGDPKVEAIAEAARKLNELRENWLNPDPVEGHAVPESELKKRTLTNLYNQRPTWLENAHRKLDEAVFAAYGWPPDLADEEVLARLLALNLERAGADAES